ncbi:pyridoxal phosphate-dependent transferase [Hysterangium stoloniferum]|nr:pyridoxal phosphate-dependent transferase [Hysterangium stoloniferum]
MDVKAFRTAGYQAIDRICDYISSLEDRKVVSVVKPGYLREALPDCAPDKGENFEEIANDFQDLILPGITHWQHPSFFAWYPCAGTMEGILGDLYASSITNPAFNWISSPACTELEAIVMDWSAKLFGLSDAFLNMSGVGGGAIQTTASESAMTVVVAAREDFIRRHPDIPMEKLVLYITTETHILGIKTAMILGITCRALEVKAEDDYGLRGDALRAALEEDKANGMHPFVLIATVGTTGTGAVDRIDEIGSIAQEHGLWLHIDSAWAGVAMACPEYRGLCQLDAINTYADSFCTNLHKWGLVNFDASTLWVRDRTQLTQALDVMPPEYLGSKVKEEGTVIDYRNWQLFFGRRFRSLKIWFVLRSFGVQGFQAYIRKGVALSNKFSSLVEASPYFEIVTPPSLALTVFRLLPPADMDIDRTDNTSINALNRLFNRRLLDRDLMLTTVDVGDALCIRLAVGSQQTEEKHIDKAWEVLCAEVGPAIEEWKAIGDVPQSWMSSMYRKSGGEEKPGAK